MDFRETLEWCQTFNGHSSLQVFKLGTIHILRKHLYSIKFNLTSEFFPKTFFLVKSKEIIFQHYILTKFSSFSLKYLVHKEEENAQKIRENITF